MNYTLLFKVEKIKNPFIVVSRSNDVELIKFNNDLERVDYSPDVVISNDQCYQIKDFNKKDYCPDFLKNALSTNGYAKWERKQQSIEYILYTNGENFYFQKFIKSQLLKKYWLLISGEPILRSDNIITINPYATAYYSSESNTLLFKKLEDLKKIFLGIEELYREATQEEVATFFNNDLFNTESYEKNNLGTLNRKRIALVKDRLNEISNKKYFCRKLSQYCPNIEIRNEDTIVIKTESDLKNALYALDEKFYTTEISNEKRLANSVIKLS